MNLKSERKRLDSQYYIECTFIEYWLKHINATLLIDQKDEIMKKNDFEL